MSGGAGVIGRELVDKLYNEGALIFVGDLKQRPSDWHDGIIYRQGDLNYITKEELDSFSPEYFFHLAATFERSTETYDFWNENDHHNIKLGHHLMTCLKGSSTLKKVIFASSYLIYRSEQYLFKEPQQEAVSLNENDPIYPRNLTGVAKFLHEIELRFLQNFEQTKYTTVSARIYRVYGKNSRDVISRWITMLLKGEKIKLYRKEGIFDYIYAGDVAEGLLRLAKSNAQGIFNLGTGYGRRVSEIIEMLKQHFPEMKIEEMDSGIPYEASKANMEKFQQETNWIPSCQLEEGIQKLIDHERTKICPVLQEKSIGNILVTSASKKVPLIEILKKAKEKIGKNFSIYAGDVDENCISKEFADQFWQMPVLDKLPVNELITFCHENAITMIIPTRDGELLYFAENKNKLQENGISVLVSDPKPIRICLDKLDFYNELKNLGYPAIETNDDITKINSNRFVVKDRFGAGSKNIGLNLTMNKAIEQSKKINNPIFQPFIDGNEVSIDLYIDKQKNVKGVIVRTRDVVIDGESQVTTIMRNPILEEMAEQLVKDLCLYGHVVMQVLIGRKGDFNIIEINSRFGGASTLSVNAGLDSFYWFVLESTGTFLNDYPFIRSKKDLKLVRYPKDAIL